MFSNNAEMLGIWVGKHYSTVESTVLGQHNQHLMGPGDRPGSPSLVPVTLGRPIFDPQLGREHQARNRRADLQAPSRTPQSIPTLIRLSPSQHGINYLPWIHLNVEEA